MAMSDNIHFQLSHNSLPADNLAKLQTVWTRSILSDLIGIQTVSHSDGISQRML